MMPMLHHTRFCYPSSYSTMTDVTGLISVRLLVRPLSTLVSRQERERAQAQIRRMGKPPSQISTLATRVKFLSLATATLPRSKLHTSL
eukprot:scaffold6789_cov221-Skeletonema_dohrnii-CCMP3373.AAC.3